MPASIRWTVAPIHSGRFSQSAQLMGATPRMRGAIPGWTFKQATWGKVKICGSRMPAPQCSSTSGLNPPIASTASGPFADGTYTSPSGGGAMSGRGANLKSCSPSCVWRIEIARWSGYDETISSAFSMPNRPILRRHRLKFRSIRESFGGRTATIPPFPNRLATRAYVYRNNSSPRNCA